MVITGQPGNGKSTISRFITQVYRASFMADDQPTGRAAEVIDGTRSALSRLHLAGPCNRRWPIRVDLAQFADDLGPGGYISLLRWLGAKVSGRAKVDIAPAELKRWMRCWPWLVVLDGLDEVTSPHVRRRVLDEIEVFVEEADRLDADMLVVVTTRPTGYTERVAPEHFIQFDLKYLTVDAAQGYGQLVTSQRLADDLERRDEVLARFTKHARNPATARLMKTPLQVLIITIILERLGSLPPDRYQLFWRYYEMIYDRELAKNTTLRTLLMQQRNSITSVHEAVGLTLQARAETATDARALLPTEQLRQLTEDQLVELGHEKGLELRKLADTIVTAATHRLVLLVPGKDDTVTFEIRSLQELMAARALSNDTDERIRSLLSLTAPSPHWRNTWMFAAGRLFFEGPHHRRDLITEIVETIDQRPHWPGWLCPMMCPADSGQLNCG
jgi:predicted NACHT family NTPase